MLLVFYACGLAVATFVEKYYGTPAAKAWVYYSPFFFLVQLLMVVNFVGSAISNRLFKRQKWGMLIVHFSLIVILLGASVSHLFAEEGVMHIREGEASDQMVIQTGEKQTFHTLPFHVELIRFTLTRYPGSSSPSSYESELLIHADGKTRHERVYMNRVLDLKGYRFFQASYDPDEGGTVLSVNKDVAGRRITYTGYFLLIIGFMSCLMSKHSRFSSLIRQLKELRKPGAVVLLYIFYSANVTASSLPGNAQRYIIPDSHANKLAALPVQASNGRMVPFDTFASEVLRKLHKSTTIGPFTANQFLISLLAMPDQWIEVPLIAVSNNELTSFYNLSPSHCAYRELFDERGNYKLQARLNEAYQRVPAERSRFDKDLLKLDEQVNTFYQLLNRRMLNLFPKEDDAHNTWYAPGDDLSVFSGKDSLFVSRIMDWYVEEVQASLKSREWSMPDEIVEMISVYQQAKNKTLDISAKRMQTEIRYNHLNIFNHCKKGYLITGGVLLIFSLLSLSQKKRWMACLMFVLGIGVTICFAFHTYGMGMRWYISGYAPWSNSYETMIYVAWATLVAGLIFVRKSPVTFALATLFAGIILFVSGLNWMDPQINPLVPVLKSYWLMFHVAVIVAAYGFFGLSCLLGITNQVLMIASKKKTGASHIHIRKLSLINEMSLWIGLSLMTTGTFLGAIWANESWGRYWGWDPKETWALITVIIYSITLHLRLVKRWNNLWTLNFLSTASFFSALMTFFGVNYLLSGMHSYGQSDHMESVSVAIYIATGIIGILGALSKRSYK